MAVFLPLGKFIYKGLELFYKHLTIEKTLQTVNFKASNNFKSCF